MDDARVREFFAYMKERYKIRLRQKAKEPMPWTKDPILQTRFFCNVFRKHDRTSRYIFKLINQQELYAAKLRAALVGRHINRSDQIPLVWEAVQTGSLAKVERVMETVVFADTYKIHTKRGMWNRLGVAEACMQPLKGTYSSALCMDDARNALSYTTNSPFLLYQVLLDLWSCNVFPKEFEPDDWIWMAGGTFRALSYLGGEFTYNDQRIGRTSWDRPPNKAESVMLESRIRQLTRFQYRHGWLEKWPKLGVHDIEFNLCEFDKYNRVKNEGAQRMHIRYYPVRKRYA